MKAFISQGKRPVPAIKSILLSGVPLSKQCWQAEPTNRPTMQCIMKDLPEATMGRPPTQFIGEKLPNVPVPSESPMRDVRDWWQELRLFVGGSQFTNWTDVSDQIQGQTIHTVIVMRDSSC